MLGDGIPAALPRRSPPFLGSVLHQQRRNVVVLRKHTPNWVRHHGLRCTGSAV